MDCEVFGVVIVKVQGDVLLLFKLLCVLLLIVVVVSYCKSDKVLWWEQEVVVLGVVYMFSLFLDEVGWGVIWCIGYYMCVKVVVKVYGFDKNEELLGWFYVGVKFVGWKLGWCKFVDVCKFLIWMLKFGVKKGKKKVKQDEVFEGWQCQCWCCYGSVMSIDVMVMSIIVIICQRVGLVVVGQSRLMMIEVMSWLRIDFSFISRILVCVMISVLRRMQVVFRKLLIQSYGLVGSVDGVLWRVMFILVVSVSIRVLVMKFINVVVSGDCICCVSCLLVVVCYVMLMLVVNGSSSIYSGVEVRMLLDSEILIVVSVSILLSMCLGVIVIMLVGLNLIWLRMSLCMVCFVMMFIENSEIFSIFVVIFCVDIVSVLYVLFSSIQNGIVCLWMFVYS